jgi:hypothetical protein
MILLIVIALILLWLNGGKTVGVGRIVVQVFKIIIAIIVIKLLLMLLAGFLMFEFLRPSLHYLMHL